MDILSNILTFICDAAKWLWDKIYKITVGLLSGLFGALFLMVIIPIVIALGLVAIPCFLIYEGLACLYKHGDSIVNAKVVHTTDLQYVANAYEASGKKLEIEPIADKVEKGNNNG